MRDGHAACALACVHTRARAQHAPLPSPSFCLRPLQDTTLSAYSTGQVIYDAFAARYGSGKRSIALMVRAPAAAWAELLRCVDAPL